MSQVQTQSRTAKRTDILSVLIADADPTEHGKIAHLLRQQFGRWVRLETAGTAAAALEIIARGPTDAVLIDPRLPDMEIGPFLAEIESLQPDVATILLASDEEGQAVEAIRSGAKDSLVKGEITRESLSRALSNAMRQTELQTEYTQLFEQFRQTQEEMDHLVRAVSHDVSASFMVLEHSYGRLKRELDDPDRPELAEAVGHVNACLSESKRFLQDLAGLAKTGRVEMEPSWVNTDQVVKDVLFEQRDLLTEHGVVASVPGPLPLVWCNPRRVKQVLTNLIRNAVKHGCDPACPRITITSPTRASDNANRGGGFAAIRVHDNGAGIDPEFHEKIFLPGQRLSDADGSGMGLAIVKKIVEHYGGSVAVDPEVPLGTAIAFTLPITEGSETASLKRASTLPRQSEATRRMFEQESSGRMRLHSPREIGHPKGPHGV